MGAVTSTVLFLLNSVTLGQVKAGTSSFIPLVLTYLSARCSVCVLDLDSQVRSVGRDISEGLGRKQPDLHLGTLVSKLFFLSGLLSVKLNVLINFLHTLRPPLISRHSISLSPTCSASLMAPESFFSAKSSLFIPLFLILMLICFSPLGTLLYSLSWLGWKELHSGNLPFPTRCNLISSFGDSWLQVPTWLSEKAPWQ